MSVRWEFAECLLNVSLKRPERKLKVCRAVHGLAGRVVRGISTADHMPTEPMATRGRVTGGLIKSPPLVFVRILARMNRLARMASGDPLRKAPPFAGRFQAGRASRRCPRWSTHPQAPNSARGRGPRASDHPKSCHASSLPPFVSSVVWGCCASM